MVDPSVYDDPVQEQDLFNQLNPDRQVTEMEEFTEHVEEFKQSLDDDAVDIAKSYVELVAKAYNTKRKAQEVRKMMED